MNCAHRPCTCSDTPVEQQGRRYCSETCAASGSVGVESDACNCPHDGCGGHFSAVPGA